MFIKKGQITIFFILSFVLIIAAAFAYMVYYEGRQENLGVNDKAKLESEQNSIQLLTQSCLKQVLDKSLEVLGENGGYVYRTPNLKIQYTEDYTFTFLYIDRTRFLPRTDKIESAIESYVGENLRYCFDDFAIYEKKTWDIKIPGIKTRATIGENDVLVAVEFPAKFKRSGVSFTLGNFYAKSDVRLKKILSEANSVLDDAERFQHEIDDGSSPPPPQSQFSRNGLLFLDYQYPETGRFLWIIKDKKYEFFFAVNLET